MSDDLLFSPLLLCLNEQGSDHTFTIWIRLFWWLNLSIRISRNRVLLMKWPTGIWTHLVRKTSVLNILSEQNCMSDGGEVGANILDDMDRKYVHFSSVAISASVYRIVGLTHPQWFLTWIMEYSCILLQTQILWNDVALLCIMKHKLRMPCTCM